jgi:DtxR family Mn-dependent transcriptional regulator
MLKKLDGLGYATQVKRQGVELTSAGRQAALEVIRHHRLLETYLATRLGMPWDEVHREAEVLEHHVSGALADRIAEALGHPERDPHGHPIPTSAGHVATTPARRLSEVPEGATAVVGRVDDRDDALLRFLAERGLVPDAGVEVLGHAPFGGPISVRVDGEHGVEVPPAAAAAVHVV